MGGGSNGASPYLCGRCDGSPVHTSLALLALPALLALLALLLASATPWLIALLDAVAADPCTKMWPQCLQIYRGGGGEWCAVCDACVCGEWCVPCLCRVMVE